MRRRPVRNEVSPDVDTDPPGIYDTGLIVL